MQVTCTGCWSRYPEGTVWCSSCKQPIEEVRQIGGQRETTNYSYRLPAIVRTVRILLFVRALCISIPAAIVVLAPDRVETIFGAGSRTPSVNGVAPGSLVVAIGIGTVVGWLLPALVARWYIGRLLLLGGIFLAEFARYVVFHADISILANQIDVLGSGVLLAALVYSAAKPE